MIKLDEFSATRTEVQRGGRDVWTITITRANGTQVSRSMTITELRKRTLRQSTVHTQRLADLALAKIDQEPPPPAEDPPTDPPWEDIVTPAQDAVDTAARKVDDLAFLLDLLERGGEE